MVVLEEIRRSEDNPRRRTFYRAMETCFTNLPYRRPVLGPATVIEQLTPLQMQDFHNQWYQPQNMTAAVVGNLPVDQMIEIVSEGVSQTFSKQEATPKQPSPWQPEPQFEEIIHQEYQDPSLQQARLVMMWRVPGMTELANTYALDILAVILGQGKVSRLFRELREEKGLVSQIGVSNMTQGMQGVFYISAQLPTENIPEVEKAIAGHIRRIQNEPLAETELARIRTQVANRFIFANERPSDRANLYGYYHSLLGKLEPALNYPEYIKSLNAAQIQAAAQKYLSPEAYGIVIMKPSP